MAKHDFTAVDLLASRRNGKLYLGATTDLISRMIVHRAGAGPAIAVRHGCRLLVWFERRADMDDAVRRAARLPFSYQNSPPVSRWHTRSS
jgi:putative endonuclease